MAGNHAVKLVLFCFVLFLPAGHRVYLLASYPPGARDSTTELLGTLAGFGSASTELYWSYVNFCCCNSIAHIQVTCWTSTLVKAWVKAWCLPFWLFPG